MQYRDWIQSLIIISNLLYSNFVRRDNNEYKEKK
ncbi:MAG: hypothetical protein PWR14_321 [Thermosediminibacterales bacterium]|jgi:hypothetical protein|nr:hypothetical protein [Thermosediminibacterales bacterium]